MSYQENIKIAAYAGSGVGKTALISHLIKSAGIANVGIISCEHGLNTIASLVDPQNVKVCDSLADYADAVKWAEKTFTATDQWVCVDGGSRILQWLEQDTFGRTEACLRERLEGVAKSKDPEYAVYLTSSNAIDTRRLWSKLGSRAERLFNAFVKLPSNTYWTFWEQQPFVDANTRGVTWTIDSPGDGTRKAAQATMDFVFRLTRSAEGKLVARFRNDIVSYGKRRDDNEAGVFVPDEIVGFDLADFVKRVRGEGWPRS